MGYAASQGGLRRRIVMGMLGRRKFIYGATAGATAMGLVPGPAHALADSTRASGRRGGVAELVICNGRVLPMTPGFPVMDTVALRGGHVMAVGHEREMRGLVDRHTTVLDARGGTVLPGINDSHLHLNGLGLTFPPFSVDVDTPTIEELVACVAEAVALATTGDTWIRGQKWNANRLPRPPHRHDLDKVTRNHPAVLTDFSGHTLAANSKAMRIAGITRDTVPPAGGVIDRDADGEPTGIFREGAQDLIRRVIPEFSQGEVSRGIDAAISVLLERGITSVTDPGISLDTFRLYATKHREGRLPIRLNVLLDGGRSPEALREVLAARRPQGDLDPQHLRVSGVKIFADGIPTEAKTAWLHQPYLDGSNGALTVAGATHSEQLANLQEMIQISHDAGMQIGTHATGDAAIDAVVAAYLNAMKADPRDDPRHYIIHGDLTPPATLQAMARHSVGLNMNGAIKYLLGRTVEQVLGPERTDYQWPYRSALDAGVRVSTSSDAPVTPPVWLQGVAGAVLREGRFGGTAGEAERISLPEALHTCTSTPAWQDHSESWKGTLRPGQIADICVLDADIMDVDPHDLPQVPVRATLIAGKTCYELSSTRPSRTGHARLTNNHAPGHRLQQTECCCTLNNRIRTGNNWA